MRAVVLWGSVGYCLTNYVVKPVKCEGTSMQPTLNPGDVVLAERWSALSHAIPRGAVVLARSADDPRVTVCKRVTALGGERVPHPPGGHTPVPPGHVWLEGDNPQTSVDSRDYGPVPGGLLWGRVMARVWPPGMI